MTKIILCADDSVTMQAVAEITFKATDFTYVGARSADEAVQKAKAQKPALVLADAVMPGKTGYDLCQALKADPALADVPVVILCGNSQAYDPARGAQVGADGSLSKPWDTQVMLDKVAEFVDKGSTAKPKAAGAAAAAPVATPPVAAAASSAARSQTIMGMPSIKLPPGIATPVPPTPAAPVAVAAPPIAKVPEPAPTPARVPPVAPTPRAPAPVTPITARAKEPSAPPQSMPASAEVGRPAMIAGTPTKRSALVERTLAKMAARLSEATGLAPGSPELLALLKLSTEVVERIVWEVVPDLAEQIIRENLQELAAARRN